MLRKLSLTVVAFVVAASCSGQRAEPTLHGSETAATQATAAIESVKSGQKGSTADNESRFKDWVNAQLEAKGASLADLTDRKQWPFAPMQNSEIVLGLGKFPAEAAVAAQGTPFGYHPFVLLLQSNAAEATPKLLGIALRTDMYMDPPERRVIRPEAIQAGAFRIKEDEYAFGVTVISGEVVQHAGTLYGMMGLYRYHDGALKEIYRDVVWAYGKYSEPDSASCTVEMEIVTPPSKDSIFYSITRQYKRSYLGNSKNPEYRSLNSGETPVPSCSMTADYRAPYTQEWNPDKELYLDHRGLFLNDADLLELNFPPKPLRYRTPAPR